MAELFGRFPSISSNGGVRAGAAVRARRRWSRRASPPQSHLRMSYRPTIDPRAPAERAALGVYSTLLGGSMGSRLFDEIREQRGLAYSRLRARPLLRRRADPPALGRPGLDEVRRGLHAHARDRRRAAHRRADARRRSSAPAPTPPGRRVLAFENTNAVARHAATQTVVFGQDIDPDKAIEALDAVTYDQVVEVARGISEELSVACVGPHTQDEFS